jgi:hypothetical protein
MALPRFAFSPQQAQMVELKRRVSALRAELCAGGCQGLEQDALRDHRRRGRGRPGGRRRARRLLRAAAAVARALTCVHVLPRSRVPRVAPYRGRAG